jgi:AraC-like DNA-binding protein
MDDDSTGLFGMSMVDVICAAAARTLGSDLSLFRPMPVKDQILLKARQFIEANLSNPDLGCVDVARHCGISTRYLNTLFTAMPNDVTCTSYIKALRLARCREALQNRDLLHRRAADIAADWGFFDAPSFTRLYKATFGKTPGQDRPPCEH